LLMEYLLNLQSARAIVNSCRPQPLSGGLADRFPRLALPPRSVSRPAGSRSPTPMNPSPWFLPPRVLEAPLLQNPRRVFNLRCQTCGRTLSLHRADAVPTGFALARRSNETWHRGGGGSQQKPRTARPPYISRIFPMKSKIPPNDPSRKPETLALRLCNCRPGRALLHFCAALRRPKNFRWHWRCVLRMDPKRSKPPNRLR